MATLSDEACALTSGIYVAEQTITVPNLSEALKLLYLHSSVFALEKPSNMLHFEGFFL